MILVLNQSPLSTIFAIVQFPGSTKLVLSRDPLYFLSNIPISHVLHHGNGHLGLVCVLWLDNIYFHMNVQSMLGRTGLSRFHFMLDIVLRHNTIRVENGLSDNRTCLPSKCLWGCAQLCYLYATLDFFSKKDGFKVEKCQSFVKVIKLYMYLFYYRHDFLEFSFGFRSKLFCFSRKI